MRCALSFLIGIFLSLELCGQLVLPGDYPDPSVTKIGTTYWASATTSNWSPIFPLLSSTDLVHWKLKDVVFEEPPAWADYYFWAPEISYDNGKIYIYYSAHKKGGNLCLSVATADKPEGPYRDLGPVMCQEAGSIDAFPMRDTNGKLYLIWKEDGNSIGQPTPIWISEMKEDRSGLVGEKSELFRNDAAWESNLVEGVSMIRHNNFFYAFYAAAGCCGRGCTYATGVARAKSLLGPWEKYSANPLLTSDEQWICPGHGTPIEKDGRYYFLYHGYEKQSNVYTGRQGLLKEFVFTDDGWVKFVDSKTYANVYVNDPFKDDFKSSTLDQTWQWPVLARPKTSFTNGQLELYGRPDTLSFVGQKITDGEYSASTEINLSHSTAEPGLGAYGDENNFLVVSVQKDRIRVIRKQAGNESVVVEQSIAFENKACLQVKVAEGHKYTFLYSKDKSKWTTLNEAPIDGAFLPPWDRAVRVGLSSKGGFDKKAVFEYFILYH